MALGIHNIILSSASILAAIYIKKYEGIDQVKVLPDIVSNYLFPQVKEYDFIIVGAGSAGGTVANRLSKEFTVLLLEAGGDPIPSTYVPLNYAFNFDDPALMHIWKSVKQEHSSFDTGGFSTIGQGRFLGGTSAINALNYNRGHPKDYDNWANITGDNSWAYTNLLEYFKMTEDFHEEENADEHLGVTGGVPLIIRKGGTEYKEMYEAFITAGKELGYKEFQNSNAPQREGFGPISETIHFGRRVSIYDAFIKPILVRPTLTISKYSTASKIHIDATNQAVGVFYTRHGVKSYAKSKFEVILSAGALNSPMILLRSGIGPKKQLEKIGIPVKSNLPVGLNYQDHPLAVLCGKFNHTLKYPVNNVNQQDFDDFTGKCKGPLTVPWGIIGQAFIVSSIAKSEGHNNWPDIELVFQLKSKFNSRNIDDQVCIFPILGRSLSRGTIKLDATNIMNQGIWDPKYLQNERDAKVLAEGLKISGKLLDSKTFRALGVTLENTLTAGCEELEFGTDEYFQCHSRYVTRSCWHPVGTCKMGREDDPTSVVDSKLRVRGIKALRVIDNSIQPVITNANTNAPAIVIGQKGADMILQGYREGHHEVDKIQ